MYSKPSARRATGLQTNNNPMDQGGESVQSSILYFSVTTALISFSIVLMLYIP